MDNYYFLYAYSMSIGVQIHAINKEGKMLFPHNFSYDADLFSNPTLLMQIYYHYQNKVLTIDSDICKNIHYGIFFFEDVLYVIGPCAQKGITEEEINDFKKFYKKENLYVPYASNEALFRAIECTRSVIAEKRTTIDEIIMNSGASKYFHEAKKEIGKQTINRNIAEDEISTTGDGSEDLKTVYGSNITKSFLTDLNMFSSYDFEELKLIEATELYKSKEKLINGKIEEKEAEQFLITYLSMLRHSKTEDEIKSLHYSAIRQADDLIYKKNHEGSYYIIKAKNYLQSHVRKKFSLSEMAEKLGINKSYLSVLFKKECGVTIMEHLLNMRLEATCDMLKYTDYSYSDIAYFYLFSSQSRYIERFKKKYGITPAKYRKDNSVMNAQK